MNETVIILIILVAVVANYGWRRFIMKKVKKNLKNTDYLNVSNALSEQNGIDIDDLLSTYAEKKSRTDSLINLSELHPMIADFMSKYENLYFDKYTPVIDAKFAITPFNYNSKYLQIGTIGDGSEILVKRDIADSSIYIADIEGSLPNEPNLYAESLDEYIKAAWSMRTSNNPTSNNP